MKKFYNPFKKIIATLLVAMFLLSINTPSTSIPSNIVSTYSNEHNDTGKLPRA